MGVNSLPKTVTRQRRGCVNESQGGKWKGQGRERKEDGKEEKRG